MLILAMVATLAMAGGTTMAAERLARITVDAGKYERIDTPMAVAVNGITDLKPLRMEEVAPSGRVMVATQIEAGPPRRVCWILTGKTPAGSKRTFDVWPIEAPDAKSPPVEVRTDAKGLEIVCGDAKVLRYCSVPVEPPAGVESKFAHGAYIHPAWTPSGMAATEDFPSDHRHQRGIFFAWTKTEFGDRHPDFWNLGAETGAVRSVGVQATAGGAVFGGFKASHEWLDLKAAGGAKAILKETWDVRVWNLGGPKAGYWMWDLTSTQRCASESELKFPKYHYGGLGVRGAPEWMTTCLMLTSEGKDRKNGNETKGRWCEVGGASGDKAAGILILGHPQNFRFPEPLRLNPQQPQICFAPSQEGDWTIEPGKDYVWRYRFIVHDGAMKADAANRLWADFGEPPAVKVEP
jgi:hypothetical protein